MKRFIPVLAIVVAISAVYGGMLQTGWHFDDDKAVREHLGVMNEDWGGVSGLFTGRGLVIFFYVLCKWMAVGSSPLAYHVMDLVLHVGVSLVLYALLGAWGDLRGKPVNLFWRMVAVLAWAIHPATSQGAIYIAQCYERLCALFYLLSLFFFLKGLGGGASFSPSWARWAWGAGALLFWALALGAKENAVTLPLVMLVLAAALCRGEHPLWAGVGTGLVWRGFFAHAGVCLALFAWPPGIGMALFLTAAAIVALLLWASGWEEGEALAAGRRAFLTLAVFLSVLQLWTHLGVANQLLHNQDVLAASPEARSFYGDPVRRRTRGPLDAVGDVIWRNEYFLTQSRVILRYAGLWVLPQGLNIDHDWNVVYLLADAPDVALLWMVWIGAGFWAVGRVAARGDTTAFGIFWALATLAPTSSLFRVADFIFEHRLYLPALGSAWIVAFLGPCLPFGKCARACAVSALVLLGFFASHRVLTWKDDRSLYADSVRKAPRGFRPRTNLGLGFQDQRDFRRAEREHLLSAWMFRDILWVEPFGNLGNIYLQTGEWEKARRCYETVLNMNGDYKARMMLANLYSRSAEASAARGESDRARDEIQTALAHVMLAFRANPRDIRIHPVVENLLARAAPPGADLREVFQRRMEALEEAFRQYDEGMRWTRQGNAQEAISCFNLAIDLFLPLGQAHAARGVLRMDAFADPEGAIQDFKMALCFPPCLQEVYIRLALLYRKKGESEAAAAIERRFQYDCPHLVYPRLWKP